MQNRLNIKHFQTQTQTHILSEKYDNIIEAMEINLGALSLIKCHYLASTINDTYIKMVSPVSLTVIIKFHSC